MGYPQGPQGPYGPPPQGGGSYQQYLPQQQQPGYGPPQPQYGPPQQQAYPPPQGGPAAGYGPAPVDFVGAFGQADLTAGGPPIAGGDYTAVIAEPVEFGTTSSGEKNMWTVKLKIDSGDAAGRGLTKRIVISPDSPKAMGMMYRQVSALTGLGMPDDPQAAPHWQQGGQYLAGLMRPGTPVDIEVSLKPRNDDPSRMTNDVEMIHPRGHRQQQAAPAAPPQAQPPAQPQYAPPAQPGPAQPQYQQPAQPLPAPQQYGAQQAAQPHPGGQQEFAPPQPQGIGEQAGQNGQPPQPAQPGQQGQGTLPAPPWQQG